MEARVKGWDSESCPIIRCRSWGQGLFDLFAREYLEREAEAEAKAEALKASEEVMEGIEAVEEAGGRLLGAELGAKTSLSEDGHSGSLSQGRLGGGLLLLHLILALLV